jgi:hypothetical protein
VTPETRVQVPNEEEIRQELNHVLSSPVFRGSKRCHDFVSYVCNQAMQGAAETLKERTIAIEVFSRRASEDYGDDNIVRVGAREVRKRLALYYNSEGADDAVRINLPTGSYIPVFRYHTNQTQFPVAVPPPTVAVSTEPDSTLSQELNTSTRYGRLWIVAAAAVIIGISAIWLIPSQHSASLSDTFWTPAFDSPAPVLLLMPHPIVYQPSSRALLLDMQINGKPNLAVSRAISLSPDRLNGSDFVPVFNQYIGFGDAVAAVNMYSVFVNHGKIAQLRLADKIEFNDLYGSTVVLIGGSFANRWTAEITKNLRYQFRFEDQSKPWIVDSQSEQKWGLASITDDRRTIEDYILICRMPQAQTGKLMVIVAGLAGFGTEAGGRILSDPKLLEPILRKLPKDWSSHNLEMVMKVEVVGEGPALPSLIAAHVW